MNILWFSALAGIVGTGLGGLVIACIGKRSARVISALLAFAAGVMISIVCFGLVPEAYELTGILVTILGLLIGMLVIALLNRLVDRVDAARGKGTEPKTGEPAALLRSGILMLIAIGLHNIPEGIAIGAGGSHNMQLGILLAVMIALHNIPEGMAIAAPLLVGGITRRRVVLMTALSGAPTLVGGLLGILLGNISATAIALSLSAAGGAMLYVVFSELIPQSVVMTKGRLSTAVSLIGIVVGLGISV